MSTFPEITRQTAGLVTTALGEGWSVDNNESLADWLAYIVGPDGARLTLEISDRWRAGGKADTDRVYISGVYPEGSRELYPSVERVEISVKRDRGPETIAKEIVRRLLPKYLPELARVVANNDKDSKAATLRAEAVAMLADAAETDARDKEAYHNYTSDPRKANRQVSFHIGHTYVDADLYHAGDRVTLQISTIPTDVAAQVLALLAQAGI